MSNTPEFLEYMCQVAENGNTLYPWHCLKSSFKRKLVRVLDEFKKHHPSNTTSNNDPFLYEARKYRLLKHFDTFEAAPFTIKRICELLTTHRDQYNRTDTFMRAIEESIYVTLTIEPGMK